MKRLFVSLCWLIGGGALVGVVFVAAFYFAMQRKLHATEVIVPELTGMTLEDAELRARPLDLHLHVTGERHDVRMASGRVVEQTPSHGAAVRRGRKIKLVMSLGGRVLRIPDLVGHAARAVALELPRQGLLPGDEARVPASDVAAGVVLAQVPTAGMPTVPGSRVHRLVSLGLPEPRWVMPDLRSRPRAEAEGWLAIAGFRRGAVRHVHRPGLTPGTVVGQLPLAGYPVRSKDIVELTVAD
jgi:serine/threonine-protein kinase